MTVNEKRQHNLRSPIFRLPNEILSNIFCDLRNTYVRATGSCQHGGHGVECLKGWINITYVCHAWREVSLNTSLLWCHIDIIARPLFRSWLPELLRRSQESPLSVIVGWTAHEHDLLEEVKKHFGRVRELVLDYPYDPPYQILSSQSNFQNLETLSLQDTPFSLQDSLLRAERLRRLILHSCSVDWNSKFFRGLTHLTLVDTPDDCILGCYDFILILSKIPALEKLHLSRFFHREEQTHQATKVHLQHLQQLDVGCIVPEMAQFLPCLVVPCSCKLRISTQRNYALICSDLRAILSWISKQLRVPTSPLPTSNTSDHGQYIRTFHLTFYRKDGLRVMGFCDVLSHERLETADPILEFVVGWSYNDDNFSFNLQTFLSLLPLGGVTFLDVSTDIDMSLSAEFWTVAFGSIRTLTIIYFDTDTSNFWEALIPANDDNRTVESLPFSALASVIVEDYVLDSQLILDTLRVRSELGGPQLRTFTSQAEASCRLLL